MKRQKPIPASLGVSEADLDALDSPAGRDLRAADAPASRKASAAPWRHPGLCPACNRPMIYSWQRQTAVCPRCQPR